MYKNNSSRRKYFSSNLMAKKKRDLFLKVGVRGFLSTCNGNEKQCVRESYNILNEYADKIFGEEQKTAVQTPANQSEDDVLDEFQKEIKELQCKGTKRRFQAVNTKIYSCIFIETTLDDPVLLMNNMVEDLLANKQKKTRFLLRMIPIEVTCKAYLDDMKKAVEPLFDRYFTNEPVTFAIVFKRRHNTDIDRDEIINHFAKMVTEKNSEHKVNLTDPTYAIVIEVMKTICGISVIRDYYKHSKYNFGLICGFDPNEKEEPESKKICGEENIKTDEADDVSKNELSAINAEKDVGLESQCELKD